MASFFLLCRVSGRSFHKRVVDILLSDFKNGGTNSLCYSVDSNLHSALSFQKDITLTRFEYECSRGSGRGMRGTMGVKRGREQVEGVDLGV